jgi:hypothetical protein
VTKFCGYQNTLDWQEPTLCQNAPFIARRLSVMFVGTQNLLLSHGTNAWSHSFEQICKVFTSKLGDAGVFTLNLRDGWCNNPRPGYLDLKFISKKDCKPPVLSQNLLIFGCQQMAKQLQTTATQIVQDGQQ